MSWSKIGGALVAVLILVLLVVARTGGGGSTAETPVTAPSGSATMAPSPGGSTRASTPGGAATRDPESGLRLVDLSALPVEARRTVALIDAGGPFPYAKDGATFGNREGILPRRRSGFYREYTVPTPGESDRGARRIVSGDGVRQLFYTGDHYASFVRIRR